MQESIISLVGQLCFVNFWDFGVKCFQTLLDIQKQDEDDDSVVFKVIRKQVVSNFSGNTPENYDVKLLMLIYELVNETQKNEILTPLFDNCFPDWI